jgi:IMP cyclohydrolase
MAYFGRIIGLGMTENERPFGVYAVSGRSDTSRERKARIVEDIDHPDDDVMMVEIGSLGELTEEQEAQRNLIFYSCMMVSGDDRLIISNGKQTDEIAGSDYINEDNYEKAIIDGFSRMDGAEPDDYKTPRIAAVVDPDILISPALGIVSEHGSAVGKIHDVRQAVYISTYKGNYRDPREVVIPELKLPAGNLGVTGKTAQELADSMYNGMDQGLVVCAASALWDPDMNSGEGGWELARKNLHD